MSGQGIKAVERDLARAHGWPIGGNPESNGRGIRNGATAAARRVHDVSRSRPDGVEFQRVDVGDRLLTDRELEANEHYLQLLQMAHLVDGAIDRGMVLPRPFFRAGLTIESPSSGLMGLGLIRGVDAVSDSPKGVGRGMPPLILTFFIMSAGALLLLIEPADYIGEIKGIITASSVYVLYWLSQRNKRRTKEQAQQHQTSDKVFEFSADKEKRLDERESKLRQEEREFMHTQIRLSRQRGHILSRGYMAMEMANDRLIELLRENKIHIPQILLTQQTRAQVLNELKDVEDEQAAMTEPKKEKPQP